MKAINCITFFLLITLKAQAQNVMTSSPYSMFGIGELESGLYGQNAAMGGVSYGMRNSKGYNSEPKYRAIWDAKFYADKYRKSGRIDSIRQ